MKKLVAAIAILAPFGVAQADSSVTIYGNVDAAIVSVSTIGGTTKPGGSVGVNSAHILREDSGVGPASRLGFRGTEDLGGGLSANFVLEAGFGADTGASQQGGVLFGRQSWVGLAGSNWTLSAGRQYAPIDVIFAAIDPSYGLYFGNATTATNHAIYPTIGATATSGTWQSTSRVNNSLLGTFKTSGLTFKLMLAAGDENTRNTGQLINPSVTYDNGPLSLSLSATRLRQAQDSILATAKPEWVSEQIAGGSYTFDFAKVFLGAYQFIGPSNFANLSPAATVGAPGAAAYAYTWSRQHSYWIGARIPVGTGTFIPSIDRIDYIYKNGTPDGHGTVLGLTYEYPFSKTTVLYANYGQTKNSATANGPLVSTITSATAGVVPYGSTIRAAAIGMRHSF
ncbi:porin [Glaciimonas sp. CA11.2]|uniref:porin n=1 Tax=unclassified Glaciimonas TaxID=2644401 RepID=UPI002AB35BC8|nr:MULTISPECIES: porin [unclassified Glaciimonas]MDY7545234.1 porin [Glaciimonas sp. CA11.2]MEB0011252.1 porin [Glaciimonas sp. Cout2]MEB0080902.1 porin [Glaciimonas sp. Gout2]MEB0161629.1 porin [Glaciimonas sp. CA11.2]